MQKALIKKENVILLANHQTETDPQIISLLLNYTRHPNLAADIIYVAGERVITDPLAIPFSMGCNLLCIYSKKHIDNPPEKKLKKQMHNKKTMELMSKLLSEGGKIIYVAPSGGRDRPNEKGVVEIAPFNPKSIEMFYLMAKKAKRKSHFYPLALDTYDILPPPDTVEQQLGEKRQTKRCPINLAFGREIDMENFPGHLAKDKKTRRKNRAEYIWSLVDSAYKKIKKKPPA